MFIALCKEEFSHDVVIEKEKRLSPIASEVGSKLLREGTIRRMKEQDENIRTVILVIDEELRESGFEEI